MTEAGKQREWRLAGPRGSRSWANWQSGCAAPAGFRYPPLSRGLWGFEHHRQLTKTLVVEEKAKGLEPKSPFADVLVAVNAATGLSAGIVEVVKLGKGLRVGIGLPQIIAGGEGAAGVKAEQSRWG